MKVVCAWCRVTISGRGVSLSHGICKKCFRMIFQPQFNFMEYLPASPQESRSSRRKNPDLGTRARSAVQQDLEFFRFLNDNNLLATDARPHPDTLPGGRVTGFRAPPHGHG